MISDPWIDRSPRIILGRKTDADRRFEVKVRHAELRAAGRCINGPLVGSVGKMGVVHGVVVRAGRCQRCWDIKTGADAASYERKRAA